MTRPQPSTIPISETFSGDIGYRIEGVSDHHMPAGYEDYFCVIHEINVEMLSLQTLILRGSFTVDGDPGSLQNLYEEQSWKFHRTANLLKKNPRAKFNHPAPLFALLLNKHLQVVGTKIRTIKHPDLPVISDQSCELILLPDSYPPLAGLPEGSTYSYYDKKATIFYSDLILGAQYDFEIELEANAATFEFAPIFPYGTVTIEKFNASSQEYGFDALGIKVKPTRGKKFSEWYEESIDHKSNWQPRRQKFLSASAFRGTDMLFDVGSLVMVHEPKTEDDLDRIMNGLLLDLDKSIRLRGFETVRFSFIVSIPPNKNFEVNVRTIQRPLPPRIYEKMQSLPMYQDVLVRYDIFNLSHKKMRLRVETEILGYTEKARNVMFVHGLNSHGKKSRDVVFQCPILKRGLLEKLVKPERAMMHCVVADEDTREVLFDETRNIDLLANDEMVWGIKDIRSNTEFELQDFICAWITPRDSEGLIEKLRTEAAKLRQSKVFGDQTQTLNDIESHVRAVYDHLTSIGMTYVSQPYSSSSLSTSQRVVLPEVVLRNNAGNCIDLVVLFASILEGIGIFSLIFMPEGHAFIGWGNKDNPNEILFLETTVLGHCTFDEAVALGKKAYEKDFTMVGLQGDRMMPPFLMAQMRGCHIVDTMGVRYSGKISSR